jgi:hypothetical protein
VAVAGASTALAIVFCALWLLARDQSAADVLVVQSGAVTGTPDISSPWFFSVTQRGQSLFTNVPLHGPVAVHLKRGVYTVSALGGLCTTQIHTAGFDVIDVDASGHIGRNDTKCSLWHDPLAVG